MARSEREVTPHGRLPGETGSPPIAVRSAEPRVFGVVPAFFALLLGVCGLLLGAILLVSGSVAAGLILFGAGGVLLVFAVDAGRRWPNSIVARGFVRAVDATADRLGLARVFAGTWSNAVREIIRLRAEARSLREEREREQHELGAAAYREDEAEMDSRRKRIEELERQIEEHEAEIERTLHSARERVDRQRVSIKPTRPIAVEETRPTAEFGEEPARDPTEVRPRDRP